MAGDQKRARTTLKRIEQHALIGHFRYRVEQGWGRYYALCGHYEAAFKHYQKAVEHGVYRVKKKVFVNALNLMRYFRLV
ncbi:MAG: hypothetical protein DRR16_04290 [Candidatus Parabeggiatoa sp. nov. 3]|nr:MAG: hypothetical protein DRR00_12385 [Gammaproteobacteria bacterium]RKZ88719.1 MAG: hypothetical protein DRR16_04290 [Gammaproteobacteria bacterium]